LPTEPRYRPSAQDGGLVRLREQAKYVRIIFWAELLCAVSVNLCGFALPLVWHLADMPAECVYRLFEISQLVGPFSMLFVVYAVLRLTAPSGGRTVTRGQVALRVFVLLELTLQLMLTARRHGVVFPTPLVFWISRHVLYVFLVVGVFAFLGSVLHDIFEHRRARSAIVVGVAVGVATILIRFSAVPLLSSIHMSETAINWVMLLLDGAVGACAFPALWRIQKTFQRVAESRCVDCGYLLRGLLGPRCPECGTEFAGAPTSGD
jgi:hypothetical protein